MEKPKGKPGRPKQIVTRNLLAVRTAANSLNFNLVAEYIKTIQKIEDPVEQAKAQQFLFKYMYPAFKEVELSPEIVTDIMNEEAIDVTPKQLSNDELLKAIEEDDNEQ